MKNNSIQSPHPYDKMPLEDIREIYYQKMQEKIIEKYTLPAKPSSDGYYHLYLKDPLSKKRKSVKAKTLDALKEKIYQFENGASGQSKKTFKTCFEISQSEKLRYVKNKEKTLSIQNTISRNQSEYKRFFEGSFIENRFIEEISKKDLEEVVEANLRKYDLHPKGLASMRSILNSIFTLAYQENWILENPYLRIDFKKYSDMLSVPTPTEERGYTDAEIERIMRQIHASQEKTPRYVTAYALELQIICGLRRGEVPPLRWSDVHDSHILICREQLTVKKTENIPEHFEIVGHTKTYKNRRFPITDELEDFLKRLKAIHEKYYPDSEFLFPAKTENGCITNNCVYNYFRRICRKENIRISKEAIKGTHAFRRTRITEAINKSGGNIVMASELFGNSPEVAKKYYYTGIDLDEARNILNN